MTEIGRLFCLVIDCTGDGAYAGRDGRGEGLSGVFPLHTFQPTVMEDNNAVDWMREEREMIADGFRRNRHLLKASNAETCKVECQPPSTHATP